MATCSTSRWTSTSGIRSALCAWLQPARTFRTRRRSMCPSGSRQFLSERVQRLRAQTNREGPADRPGQHRSKLQLQSTSHSVQRFHTMISNTAVQEQMSPVPKGLASPTNSVFHVHREDQSSPQDNARLDSVAGLYFATPGYRTSPTDFVMAGLRTEEWFRRISSATRLDQSAMGQVDRWRSVRPTGRLSAFDANGVAEPGSTVLFWRHQNVLSSCSGWRQERRGRRSRRALSSRAVAGRRAACSGLPPKAETYEKKRAA